MKGTAIFLTGEPDLAPSALLHNLKHNKILHEKNVVVTVKTEDTPHVLPKDRISIEPAGGSIGSIGLDQPPCMPDARLPRPTGEIESCA